MNSFRQVRCSQCNSLVGYDSTSIVEGNREIETVCCPTCNNEVAKVFTDLYPIGILVEEDEKRL